MACGVAGLPCVRTRWRCDELARETHVFLINPENGTYGGCGCVRKSLFSLCLLLFLELEVRVSGTEWFDGLCFLCSNAAFDEPSKAGYV